MTAKLTTFYCGVCRDLKPEYDLTLVEKSDMLVCSKCRKGGK